VAILDEGLRLRLPSPAEAADLAQDAFVQEYLAGLRAFLPQSCPGGRDTEDGRGLEPP